MIAIHKFNLRQALLIAALPLGLASMLAATSARADDGGVFDLGFDTSGIVREPGDVQAFMASLPAQIRLHTANACVTYLSEPQSAQAQSTLSFCRLALTGSNDTRTFATTAPRIRPPADNPILQSNPIPHYNPGFDVYPDDD